VAAFDSRIRDIESEGTIGSAKMERRFGPRTRSCARVRFLGMVAYLFLTRVMKRLVLGSVVHFCGEEHSCSDRCSAPQCTDKCNGSRDAPHSLHTCGATRCFGSCSFPGCYRACAQMDHHRLQHMRCDCGQPHPCIHECDAVNCHKHCVILDFGYTACRLLSSQDEALSATLPRQSARSCREMLRDPRFIARPLVCCTASLFPFSISLSCSVLARSLLSIRVLFTGTRNTRVFRREHLRV